MAVSFVIDGEEKTFENGTEALNYIKSLKPVYAKNKTNEPTQFTTDRINSIADECILLLDADLKNELMLYPRSSKFHETLGLHIRNKYVYQTNTVMPADVISSAVVKSILHKLLPDEYVPSNIVSRYLFEGLDETFLKWRKQYYLCYKKYPTTFLRELYARFLPIFDEYEKRITALSSEPNPLMDDPCYQLIKDCFFQEACSYLKHEIENFQTSNIAATLDNNKNHTTCKDEQIISQMAQERQKRLLEQLNISERSAEKEYYYTPYEDGIEITNYNGNQPQVIVPDTIDGHPVRSIGEGAFIKLKNIEEIILPNGLLHIRKKAFRGSSVRHISIPNTVLTIDEGAFSYTNIKKLFIPSSVRIIPTEMCYGCDKLREVFLAGAEIIEKRAFSSCAKLSSLLFPDTLLEIQQHAFSYCPQLENLIIPSSVQRISTAIDFRSDTKCVNIAVLNDDIEWVHDGVSPYANLYANLGSSTHLQAKFSIGEFGTLSSFPGNGTEANAKKRRR